MSLIKGLVAGLAAFTLANAAATPSVYRAFPGERRWLDAQLPSYHSANASTPGAAPDGSSGVFFEDDLKPGTTGKDGATVKKVKVGTYTLGPASTQTYPTPQFEVPCYNCYITAFQLGLEYPDGKRANVDTGAWCHHIDLVVLGQKDYTCPTSLAQLFTFADPAMGGERIFSAGNERVPYRLNSKSKYGVWLGNSVRWGGVLELMNERARESITVTMTITFEYVSGLSAMGYKQAQLVWLDVTNCGRESEFPAKPGKYMLASKDFTMNQDGEFLTAIGHEHDGGTHVELYHNGKLSCTSKQIYGNRRGGYVEPTDGSIAPVYLMGPNAHISDVALCKNFGEIKKGDRLSMKAYYDDSQHMQMKKPTGGLDLQMGIMFTYIGWK